MFRRFRLVHFDDTPGFGRWFLKVFEWQTVMAHSRVFKLRGLALLLARLTVFQSVVFTGYNRRPPLVNYNGCGHPDSNRTHAMH